MFKSRFPDIADEELGIVGGPSHVATGTSYHLGADQLKMSRDPYSARTARDKAGLSNAASALDITNRIGVQLLQRMSLWLVEQCRAKAADTLDIREITYSPDGVVVLTWDRQLGVTSFPTQRGNSSHREHTHVSFYRDSENHNRHAVFERFFQFEENDMAELSALLEAQINNAERDLQAIREMRDFSIGITNTVTSQNQPMQFVIAFKQLLADVAAIKAGTVAPVITDEQLERVLRKVLGSLG